MSTHRRVFVLGLIIFLLTLSACGPDAAVLPVGPDGDDSGVDADPTGPQLTEMAEGGDASIHYHYTMKHADVEYKIEPIIPVEVFDGPNTGSHLVKGHTQLNVSFRRAAGAGLSRCDVHCNVILKFSADGEITLDENTGKCIIPMQFTFVPVPDEWIMETDCPPETETVVNCAMLSVVMADPSVYTFRANDRDDTLKQDSEVTLRAVLKNFNMPSELEGICDW